MNSKLLPCKTMNISDIRRRHLIELVQKHDHGNVEAFAARTGQNASYMRQIKSGHRGMGSQVARKIEGALGLPSDWMDSHRLEVPSQELLDRMTLGESAGRYEILPPVSVPLISWVKAGIWCEASDPYEPGDSVAKVPVYGVQVSEQAYALEVRGDSMTNPHGNPTFPEGTIIIVDPQVEARSGRFIIARLEGEQEVTFKQLMIDAGEHYLKPLNPRYPVIRVDRPMTVCGVAVAKAFENLL